jgi:hypothetical protein
MIKVFPSKFISKLYLPSSISNSFIILYVARVAQSVERSAVNRKVGGSNPPVSDFYFLIIN